MTILDVLPKDDEGKIILEPAGEYQGKAIKGSVSPSFLTENFREIATSELPLSEELFNQLKGIDRFWSVNVEKWRSEGLI